MGNSKYDRWNIYVAVHGLTRREIQAVCFVFFFHENFPEDIITHLQLRLNADILFYILMASLNAKFKLFVSFFPPNFIHFRDDIIKKKSFVTKIVVNSSWH